MVGDTGVEGVMSGVLTHSSDVISNSTARPQTSAPPIQWGPPGARSGWIASLGKCTGICIYGSHAQLAPLKHGFPVG
jgi:hypothetical protein